VASLYWTVDGDGRPVVLLHAGGLDSRMFEPDAPELARSARVLRYDRSGSGRSPSSNGAVDRVEELRMVSTTAFGERPAVLVGSSFGGQLAVDFALAHPALVAGLLLVAPGLSGPRSRSAGARGSPALWPPLGKEATSSRTPG
jgi:3-oxoadipate enol-lactonase